MEITIEDTKLYTLVVHRELKKQGIGRKYGVTPERYIFMFKQQGGRCKICGARPKKSRRLAIDHCHETNKIRGLLCSPCNTALGLFQDNPELVNTAASYLKGFLD